MPHDDLTPEEEQVRRLLADARHTEPMPDDVAARLDEVLTGLKDEPRDASAARPTRTYPSAADLDAARRRRTVRTWLVAAAAVVVVGVGINQVDWSGLSAGSGDSDSADSAGSGEVPAAESAPDEANGSQDFGAWRLPVVRLDPDRFGEQVEELRSDGIALDGGALSSAEAPQTDSDSQVEREAARDLRAQHSVLCDTGRLGPGERVPARYDGQRGWLVFRAPEGDSQVVDLYLCGHDEPTRSITLPAP